MLPKSGKMWLITMVIALFPFAGPLALLYGLGRLAVRKRRAATHRSGGQNGRGPRASSHQRLSRGPGAG
jgi:hypothetical protein